MSATLSSPWVTFYRRIEAMFKEDPQIRVEYDEEENVVRLYVSNADKAEALAQLLPSGRTFGNVTIHIQVIPPNQVVKSMTDLYRAAFSGNTAFSSIEERTGLFDMKYVVFKKKVVQYHNDAINDINGNCSTLYQDLAKDIFGSDKGVFFCTES